MPSGRPSKFTKEIAKTICNKLAEGLTLREVCRIEGMPAEGTVRGWAIEDREGFFAQYEKARQIGYHCMADEAREIADDGSNDWMERNCKENEGWIANKEHVQRSRLRIDTRKWMLSKALPKIYGDKIEVDNTSSDGSMSLQGLFSSISNIGKTINGEE